MHGAQFGTTARRGGRGGGGGGGGGGLHILPPHTPMKTNAAVLPKNCVPTGFVRLLLSRIISKASEQGSLCRSNYSAHSPVEFFRRKIKTISLLAKRLLQEGLRRPASSEPLTGSTSSSWGMFVFGLFKGGGDGRTSEGMGWGGPSAIAQLYIVIPPPPPHPCPHPLSAQSDSQGQRLLRIPSAMLVTAHPSPASCH